VSARQRLFPSMTRARWAWSAALILLAAVFPLAEGNQYVMSVIVTALVLLVLNISWNFVLGVAGVWNFGQLAIYALGGYGAGIIMLHTPLPPWLAVLGGGVIAAVISVLLAFPTLRLYGIYTSLLTFAFAEIVQYVILNDGSGLTGGSFGFPIVPGLYSHLSPDASMRAYYWTVLGVVVVSMIALAAVTRSHLGIALRSVRDAPAYTAARGVSPLRYRVIAFAISGFLAGIAGALYISFNQSISPSAMGLTPMSIDVTMLVIGGLGTVFGPLIGTAVLTVVQTALVDHPGIELTVLGTFLLIVVVFVPGGLVGLIARTRNRVAAWAAEDEATPEAEAAGGEAAGDAAAATAQPAAAGPEERAAGQPVSGTGPPQPP
jgi:branched-chain amino acid transport system permease protein